MTENRYEVQRQMRQWGSVIGWATQAAFVAETDADAIAIFESRDDWRYHETMIVGDAMRMIKPSRHLSLCVKPRPRLCKAS